MKKERPILFSTEMVKAILGGMKSQTRRIIKPQPTDEWMENTRQFSKNGAMYDHKGKQLFWLSDSNSNKNDSEIKCPYGKVGDVIWVRETFCNVNKSNFNRNREFLYKAECAPNKVDNFKWRPSIFMPKEACRIWLEITGVRVERLRDISEEDAISEGVQENICDSPVTCPAFDGTVCCGKGEYFNYISGVDGEPTYSAIESYKTLWQSINGEESWKENKWVWVISFKKIDRP